MRTHALGDCLHGVRGAFMGFMVVMTVQSCHVHKFWAYWCDAGACIAQLKACPDRSPEECKSDLLNLNFTDIILLVYTYYCCILHNINATFTLTRSS